MNKTLVTFIKQRWDMIILLLLVAKYTIVLSTLSVRRHDAFASLFDLANMDQTLWYTLNGHFFQFRLPDEFVSRFSVHADLILVLLSPIYLVWNDVRALLIVSSLTLALGAIPVFLLTKTIVRNSVVAVGMATVYLLNPAMQWANIYDFHAVTLFIPLFLSAFYCAYRKRWNWYVLWIGLALLTKEDVSLNIALLGIIVFFIMKERLVGAATFVLGIVWFYGMVAHVMPYFTVNNMHWALQKMAGESDDALGHVLRQYLHTDVFIKTFLYDPEAIHYYSLLLKPFAFMPMLAFPYLLLGAPSLAINIIRHTTTITFHYASSILPALMIATIYGFRVLQWFLNRVRVSDRQSSLLISAISAVVVLVALRVNYHYSPLPTTPSCSCYIYAVTQEDRDFEKKLREIPADASVTASLEIRPHVSHRELAFTLPSATDSATYIALITQHRMISNYEKKEYETQLIAQLLADTDRFEVLHKSEHFYLFKRIP